MRTEVEGTRRKYATREVPAEGGTPLSDPRHLYLIEGEQQGGKGLEEAWAGAVSLRHRWTDS
jgi:hypothetical protein